MIALTGYGSANDHQSALSAGFDHHVVKPADPEALLQLIDSAMRRTSPTTSGEVRHLARRRKRVDASVSCDQG